MDHSISSVEKCHCLRLMGEIKDTEDTQLGSGSVSCPIFRPLHHLSKFESFDLLPVSQSTETYILRIIPLFDFQYAVPLYPSFKCALEIWSVHVLRAGDGGYRDTLERVDFLLDMWRDIMCRCLYIRSEAINQNLVIGMRVLARTAFELLCLYFGIVSQCAHSDLLDSVMCKHKLCCQLQADFDRFSVTLYKDLF